MQTSNDKIGEILHRGYTSKQFTEAVNILNEYGMSVNARITEIIESRDENGYSMEPTFENV